MTPKLVPNLRDEQLNDLGVTTISDRAALQAACQIQRGWFVQTLMVCAFTCDFFRFSK